MANHPRAPERPAGGTALVTPTHEALDLPSTMAARGFVVCRAAGGLEPSRWRPKARGAAAGRQARPWFGGASGLRSGPP